MPEYEVDCPSHHDPEKVAIGTLDTLREPTDPMLTDAAAASRPRLLRSPILAALALP